MRGAAILVVLGLLMLATATAAYLHSRGGKDWVCFTTHVEVPSDCEEPYVYIVWYYPEEEFSTGAACAVGMSSETSHASSIGAVKAWLDDKLVVHDTLPAFNWKWVIDASPGPHKLRICYRVRG